VYIAGAIDQDIEPTDLAGKVAAQSLNSVLRAHVELSRHGAQALQFAGIEIGCDHLGAGVGEFFRNGASDALTGSGYQRDFVFKAFCHVPTSAWRKT